MLFVIAMMFLIAPIHASVAADDFPRISLRAFFAIIKDQLDGNYKPMTTVLQQKPAVGYDNLVTTYLHNGKGEAVKIMVHDPDHVLMNGDKFDPL